MNRGFTSRSNDPFDGRDAEEEETERVSKILSRRGDCSRREAQRLIGGRSRAGERESDHGTGTQSVSNDVHDRNHG